MEVVTYKAVTVENFVYNYLQEQMGKLFVGVNVYTYKNVDATEETDFIVKDHGRQITGIEVKFKKDGTTTGDKILERNEISKLIKIQNTLGGNHGKKITLPIFAIDKMKYVVDDGKMDLFS